MVELGIDVKHSAYKLSKQAAEKQKKVVKVCVWVFLVIMLPRTALIIIAGKEKENPHAPDWIHLYYHTHIPTFFTLLSIGLASASYFAVRNMRLHFDERLHGEIRRIKITFIVSTAAYMSRVVAFVVYNVLANHEKIGLFLAVVIYYIGWFCWDVIPLTVIMSYQASKVKKRE